METMAYKTDEKARVKRTISKLRAKVDPSHPNYMGEAWLSTPDGQAALRRIAAYGPGQVTPGRSTVAAKLVIRKQLDSINATVITRSQGKIPQQRPDQTAAERKREIDAAHLWPFVAEAPTPHVGPLGLHGVARCAKIYGRL